MSYRLEDRSDKDPGKELNLIQALINSSLSGCHADPHPFY